MPPVAAQPATRPGVIRPRDAAWLVGTGIVKQSKDRHGKLHLRSVVAGFLAVFAVTPFLLLVAAGFLPVALFLIHLCVSGCLLLVRKAHKRRPRGTGWDSPHYAWAATLLASLGYVALALGQPRLGTLWAAVVTVGWLELLGSQPRFRVKIGDPKWTDQDVLTPNLVAAGALKPTQGVAPWVRYIGRPWEDDAGEWVQITVPEDHAPHSIRDFDKPDVRAKLASRMGIPRERLHLEEGDRADRIRICKLHERKRELVVADVPEVWDFRQPIPLGKDHLGRDHYEQIVDTHDLDVGKTRSGKTWRARRRMAYSLSDVTVMRWLISGKDAIGDWRALKDTGLVIRYETVKNPQGISDLLDDVEAEANRREDLERGTYPMGLLVVDEWARIISTVKDQNPKLADKLDGQLSRLAAICAGLDIHISVTFQRGTEDFIRTGLRANLGQRAVGITADKKEPRYVLEMEEVTLTPKHPGEFLYSIDDSTPVLITEPMLDDEAFRWVVERAARRHHDAGTLRLTPVEPPHLELVPGTGPSELDLEVWRVLGAGALQPSAIVEELPERLRSKPHVFGRELKRMEREGLIREVKGGPRGNVRMLERAPGSPWGIHLPASGLPTGTGSGAAQGAATGTDGPLPPALPGMP